MVEFRMELVDWKDEYDEENEYNDSRAPYGARGLKKTVQFPKYSSDLVELVDWRIVKQLNM